MSVTVVCVLKAGGDFNPDHVRGLKNQVQAWWNSYNWPRFVCLTDVQFNCWGVETIPLIGNWPRWWSKMEVFRPDLVQPNEDFLYMDLDTVMVGPLDIFSQNRELTVLRDFFHENKPSGATRIGSGLMHIPPHVRGPVWEEWLRRPEMWMNLYKAGGDQAFLERFWMDRSTPVQRWQDVLPGKVLSYKAHVRNNLNAVQERDARILCFHGRPRPWEIFPTFYPREGHQIRFYERAT